jgi:hypothetical protein
MSATRALERLYAVAPNEFTRTRNTLVAELRKSRDADAAREVARLRRPSTALWAVNQLARHARGPLERFLEAVDRLRRTQLSDPRGAVEAMRAERAQLETLVERARQALADAGYAASAEMRRRIGDTLLGAAADRRHADALVHGRLTEELHAPGFDALTGAPRLSVVQGGAAQRDGAATRNRAGGRERAARATVKARAEDQRARARDAKALVHEQKALERAAKAEERRREAEARRREAEARRHEAEARAAEVAALQREAAAARERLAEVQSRLKAARRGRIGRTR